MLKRNLLLIYFSVFCEGISCSENRPNSSELLEVHPESKVTSKPEFKHKVEIVQSILGFYRNYTFKLFSRSSKGTKTKTLTGIKASSEELFEVTDSSESIDHVTSSTSPPITGSSARQEFTSDTIDGISESETSTTLSTRITTIDKTFEIVPVQPERNFPGRLFRNNVLNTKSEKETNFSTTTVDSSLSLRQFRRVFAFRDKESLLKYPEYVQHLMESNNNSSNKFQNIILLLDIFVHNCHKDGVDHSVMEKAVTEMALNLERFLNHSHVAGSIPYCYYTNFTFLDIIIKGVDIKSMNQTDFCDPRGQWNIQDIDIGVVNLESYENVTVSIVVLKTPIMELNYTSVIGNQAKRSFIVSPILSLSMNVGRHSMTSSHSFTLKVNNVRRIHEEKEQYTTSYKCVYIVEETRLWSNFGCFSTGVNSSHVSCSCNHTTNFAILMQIFPVKNSITEDIALSTISYIGCTVSLVTQFIAISVFTCVEILSCERIYVHRNLCFAIAAAQITFLAGIRAVDNKTVCSIVAVALHYSYTAVFAWMLVEGLHLYSRVVRVFGSEKSRRIYYTVFGWGVPFLLVTISASVDWGGYGTKTSCWLSITRRTIWAFVGPALAIILVNLVILTSVIRVVFLSAKHERNGELNHIRAGVKSAFFLMPLLGMTWIFGLLSVNQDLVIFQYLFAISNSLQGFFIFLFHCVLNSEVRQALLRIKQKRSLQKGVDLSSSSSSSINRRSRSFPANANGLRRQNKVGPLQHTISTRTMTTS